MKKEISFFVLLGILSSLYFISCRKESTQSQPPVAVAGADITVQLPHEKIVLSGDASYDPDGDIKSYYWTKISGPEFITIPIRTYSKLTLKYLTEGIYHFELMITDKSGVSGYDTVTVTILKYPSGTEILFDPLFFYFDSYELDLYLFTNPRPDVFFDYPAPLDSYLKAEVFLKLYPDTSWRTAFPDYKFDPALGEQYLYLVYGNKMFVRRYPADPGFDSKKASVKLKFL